MVCKNIGVIFLLSACTMGCVSLTTIAPGGCGTNSNDTICLGTTTVPDEQTSLFIESSSQAVDVVASQVFIDNLEDFYASHALTGAHSAAWTNLDISSIPEELLQKIEGMEIATFGGLEGLFYKVFYGTNAFEGDGKGPILLNRWSLPRSHASIANTIVHEASHRIGLTHPNSSFNRDAANCEPPYVIGSLVEKQILGPNWNPAGHCSLL